jgi:hypothetical protein
MANVPIISHEPATAEALRSWMAALKCEHLLQTLPHRGYRLLQERSSQPGRRMGAKSDASAARIN